MRQLHSTSMTVFQADNFSQKELMYNLYLKLREPGTHDYLVDKLSFLNPHKLEFFLPQLCYLCVKLQIPKIERFLLQTSSLSMKHYFIITQLVHSYSELERRDKAKNAYIVQLQSQLETVLVNSTVPRPELEEASNTMNDHQFNQFQVLLYLEKESKSDYLVKCQNFIRSLIKISLTLKECAPEERKSQLHKHIHKGNKLIHALRETGVPAFHGILVPFTKHKQDQCESNVIVQIVEQDYTCFNTKMRVPYRIIVETIDLKDLGDLKPFLMSEKSSTTLDSDDDMMDSKSKIEDLEQAMKKMAQSKILFDYDISALTNLAKRRSQVQFQSSSRRTSQNENGIGNIQSIFERQSRRTDRVDLLQDEPQNDDEVDSFGPWEDIWDDKSWLLQSKSPYGAMQSYRVRQIIVKGGDDLRQELLCMQIITQMQRIFAREHVRLYLRPYDIIITSPNSGIIEFIPDTLSIDALKKKVVGFTGLRDFYKGVFGRDFDRAQKNFLESLAGYGLVQHFLQIKDRHNGNILIDNVGHIIHIDFGFMFTLSPGGINFESAPFKMTQEYIELIDSLESDMFLYFKSLLIQGFLALRKNVNEIISLIMMMMEGGESDLLCFRGFSLYEFRARFKEQESESEIFKHIDQLIEQSANNTRTSQYDWFQHVTNGISP